jgi:hypothetical protein
VNALFFGSVFRHVLGALGGGAVGVSVASGDPVSVEALGGAIATIIAFALSWWEKRNRPDA